MKICWTYWMHGNQEGNALGYYYAQKGQREALEAMGIEFTNDTEFAFHHVPIHMYNPIKGCFNYVYTMTEPYDLPRYFYERLLKADRIGVPSQNTKDIFRRAGLKQKIDVVPHGVYIDKFPYKERKPDGNFKFLWLGAPNQRKGPDIAALAFQKVFDQRDPVELYIKTTLDSQNEILMMITESEKKTGMPVRRMMDMATGFDLQPYDNVRIDCRHIEFEELVDLYQSAHCFLLPTSGEGFGFTAAEAMCTGAAVITSSYGGQREYCNDETSFLCDGQLEYRAVMYDGNTKYRCFTPHIDAVAAAMLMAYNDHKKTFAMGKRGAELIRKEFTWEICAEKLYKIFEECGACT